ncbi:MAG: ABC-F type ribosomal protection protein [Clostridiales bacterium]|jgi:lincosamide and streptogramin A transport system ATP-binding/permease protein|nr:ABC-F type ribosomal protection protein [Clostridiales bacterium]
MSQITVNDLSFSYDKAYDMIFENVSFQIDTDWKLGFIGRNGRGKTTFLNLLLGKYEYRGSISASVNFDYFPFDIEHEDRITMDLIKDIIAPFRAWEREMEQCIIRDQQYIKESHVANGSYNSELESEDSGISHHMDRYGELQELYQKHDGYIIEELIEKELGKLRVDLSVLFRPFVTLSFGERTKIMLAALFLKKNNFLLIDEPTNHLDMEGREVLADYLLTKGGFILVSHDRAFLDKCIDHVLSINKTNIEVQKGNFSSWYHNKTLNDNYEIERNKQLKKEIASLSEAARRTAGWSYKIEASKIGSHVGDRGFVGHKSAKMMKRAKAIESRKLDAIEDKRGLLKDIEQTDSLKMNLLSFHSKRLIELEDVSLFYDNNEIASNINLLVRADDRIAIRGANGSGKSTLLKLLLGKDIRYTGNVFVAKGLNISYVSQDTSYLDGSLTDFTEKYGLDETIFKTVLRQMDFERDQFDKDISDFSQGQRKKVLLAKSLSEPAHLFLWDEPLNFIDVFSRVQIEELIMDFCPTLVFIEHDRAFTENIATKEINLI